MSNVKTEIQNSKEHEKIKEICYHGIRFNDKEKYKLFNKEFK